jgi:folate-binding protein YgfZ
MSSAGDGVGTWTPEVIELARASRRAALVGVLRDGVGAVGMAAPALIRAEGLDAARFLHSQLTNEVQRLGPGEGNLQARVARSGHLEHVMSLHRPVDGEHLYLLVLEAEHATSLVDGLEGFLFADQVRLSVDPGWWWLTVQGPRAPEVADAVFGPIGFEPWTSLPEAAIRPLRRDRSGGAAPAGCFVIRRSLGGDAGFLIAVPSADAEGFERLAQALTEAAVAAGGAGAGARPFSDALEILRIEAGLTRVGPETVARRRLLPETGWEQAAVSYSKGCYLGQEVIARVRTYGSVPFLLRALVLEGPPEALDTLPEVGADLTLATGGHEKVGAIASRTWSVVREAPVVMAFLDRAHRTPGLLLAFEGPHGPWMGRVSLMPVYAAPDAAGRVHALYDLAIRSYADGDVPRAMELFEGALRLDPTFADAYEAIGVILGKEGRYHEAIDFFRRLEEVAPDEPMVNTNLSLYYMKIGDKETAEDESGKATLKGMARQRGRAAMAVDQDLEDGKRKDAARKRDMFRRVLEIDADDAIALFGLGNALLTLGDPDGAARHLARAVSTDKNNSAVYVSLGKAFERLERTTEAVATYRAGLEVASRRGDLMPAREMEHRLLLLGAR